MANQAASRRIQHHLSALASSPVHGSEKKEDILAHIKPAPLDPILGTKILYQKDPNPSKIDLGIGAYRTDEGKPYVLKAVRKADLIVANDTSLDKEYLSQGGHKKFCQLAAELIYGKENPVLKEDRVAVLQCLSGTGSLRVAGEFLHKFFPQATLYYSVPTWGNHIQIFQNSGIPLKTYRYWNAKTRGLDIEGMLADILAAPERSIMLLHACAHNPTGVDPTPEQWKRICEACKQRRHFAFFDLAYQGFATGDLDRDAFAIRYFVKEGFNVMVSQSFAKNFGLYNERVGTLSLVCNNKAQKDAVYSQTEQVIRAMYSNPPAHGALLVYTILSRPELGAEWLAEMKNMSKRIQDMRRLLVSELKKKNTPGDWSHITSQIGMFSYTGLTVKQCERMIAQHHVYLLSNGRISMAGVNSKNVGHLAAAIDEVVRNA